MNDEQDRKFAAAAKQLLDQAADDLDGDTLSRLHRARNRALAGTTKRPPFFRRPLPLVITSALTAAALVLFVAFGPSSQETIEKNLVADLGLLTAEESLEFFEDIEFYEWLSTVEGEENGLSRTPDGSPDPRPRGWCLESDAGSRGRESGDGDAGVSRII
ncbi:DUF3619 family protein [uncultured Desulfobulbus sp.]|uniref:DUF3619 family protein n=1 Tax=uncultured Desulfobulbus sp. TaxID=239745 RepID=UPI0029C65BA9|nr:DUF3619 family protein [uncultured Desulfobulbus sp.]